MKRITQPILLLALALSLAACSSEKVELLKSPCVGADESPCGPKRVPRYNA